MTSFVCGTDLLLGASLFCFPDKMRWLVRLEHIGSHFSYIAPELRKGTAKPFLSNDINSLAFMIKFSLYKILDFKLNGTVKNALKELSDNRPSLCESSGSLN